MFVPGPLADGLPLRTGAVLKYRINGTLHRGAGVFF
jgi:hypothetical protein